MSAFQLCYISVAADVPLGESTLNEILDEARNRNQADGITGLLVSLDDSFLQILEGEPEAVRACMDRIRRDRRHFGIQVVMQETAGRRAFADWAMAHKHLPGRAVAGNVIDIDDLSDRLRPSRQDLGPIYPFLRTFCRLNSRGKLELPD